MKVTYCDARLDDYDWAQVFGCAGEPDQCNGAVISKALGSEDISDAPFTRSDVAEILALSEGENDGADWLIVVLLHDGRFAFIQAGCDYTGWDCQSSGSTVVAKSREDLIQFGLTDEARERLRLTL